MNTKSEPTVLDAGMTLGDHEKGTTADDSARSLSPDNLSFGKEEVFTLESLDPALNAKMHLVNNAIDEIGWTGYHYKLFVLNGFGYAVDSLLLLLQSIIQGQVNLQFYPPFKAGLTIALYIGLLLGALFWGLTADVIGRKWAFNISLLVCSVFTIAAGAAPTYNSLAFFIALSAFGGGGNLILDTTVFLEFLPSSKQWLLTLLACWWGIGQMVAGLIAWPFMSDYSCPATGLCNDSNNMGWRYLMYTCGALVFLMSIARVTVIRLKETPKYCLGQNEDDKVAETLQWMATKYNRPCSLTADQLRACGQVQTSTGAKGKLSVSEFTIHWKGLFLTRKLAISTCLIWFSWTLIGLAYPLYNVFLPTYLATRGAQTGDSSNYTTWRNYAIVNMCGVWGPVLAGFLCNLRLLGRRGTMVVGALVTMVFFFAYTQVRTGAENLGFNCAISFCLNIYYGTLYAYTPEVLPSAHRATGNGISVSFNRIMGIISAVVGVYANTSTPVPIYICAALYIVMAIVAAAFPFEPYGKRSA
ncbi:hypothetical protein MMC11_006771 [Xylographa trunciseda]|nr:hypothetical protein [Xylographa trunciseda]